MSSGTTSNVDVYAKSKASRFLILCVKVPLKKACQPTFLINLMMSSYFPKPDAFSVGPESLVSPHYCLD